MKKNILIFIAGMITMLILSGLFGVITSLKNNKENSGLTLFEQDGTCINAKQIKIFQTLEPNMALAHATTKPNEIFDVNEILVLIIGEENTNYYDDQKINIPSGKCAKQVGTFQYEANNGMLKTVPAVTIK